MNSPLQQIQFCMEALRVNESRTFLCVLFSVDPFSNHLNNFLSPVFLCDLLENKRFCHDNQKIHNYFSSICENMKS